jgi:hypothetical protein
MVDLPGVGCTKRFYDNDGWFRDRFSIFRKKLGCTKFYSLILLNDIMENGSQKPTVIVKNRRHKLGPSIRAM